MSNIQTTEPRGDGLFPAPPEACPGCGGIGLEVVSDGELTNFYCSSCVSCWHVELGWVHRVGMTACQGCDHEPRCLLKEAVRSGRHAGVYA
jgi:hypothetical protein